MNNTAKRQILACLSDRRAIIAVNGVLTSRGFAVTTTYTLDQFVEAAKLGGYGAVVTVTEMLDPLRACTSLPIVNIDLFQLFTVESSSIERRNVSTFGHAFAERIAEVVRDAAPSPKVLRDRSLGVTSTANILTPKKGLRHGNGSSTT